MGLYDKITLGSKQPEPLQETEEPKSAIQPSKQFDDPTEPETNPKIEDEFELVEITQDFIDSTGIFARKEPEIKPEDEQDQGTLQAMDSVFTEKLNAGEFKTNADIPTHQERNEAYYQFRRARPGEYISFRDWMAMQQDPLAEAFISVVNPTVQYLKSSEALTPINLGEAVISPKNSLLDRCIPKADYRDGLPAGLREAQDRSGFHDRKEESSVWPVSDKHFNNQLKETAKRDEKEIESEDTGQPDLFDEVYTPQEIKEHLVKPVKTKKSKEKTTERIIEVKTDSDKIKMLAIDQASNCGWATKHASGVWDFNTKKDESSGMKMLRFRSKLKEVCALEEINLIVYERVAGFHKAAIIHAAKMVAMIESFCEENGIEYKAVSATEVKKFATGSGNANKDKMVAAAQSKLGYEGKDDNEADALWIYQLVKEELNF